MTPTPCTTPAAKKRHLSDCLSDLPGTYKGSVRRNATLCGLAGAMGQDALDARGPGKWPPLIADLPACRVCYRKAGEPR